MEKKVLLAIVVCALIALVVGYTTYTMMLEKQKERVLVIYTYESLLKWGKDPDKVWDAVFKEFGRRYKCNVTVVTFSDAGKMLQALIEEKDNPKADVVIGIDNILIFKAKEKGVLEPYTPPNIGVIREDLIKALDPEHYVIPYDYGLVAFVYDSKYVSREKMAKISFEDFYDPEFAKLLVTEDPALSSTGLNYLLWEIVFYEKVLKKDWKEWWIKVKDYIKVTESWGDAYDIFLNEAAGRHIVVSYGTDPAYSVYFYNSTRYGAAVVFYNGKYYAWLQIEGIGIVKGAKHKDLAKLFVQWFISEEVQKYMALNQWMYPANKYVKLPPEYKCAIDPSKVELLNNYVTPDYIAANLKRWLREWKQIITG